MLSLPALFGVMMAPGLVVLMASFIVGIFENEAHSFISKYHGKKLN